MELFGEKLTEKTENSILDDWLGSAWTSGHIRQHRVVGKVIKFVRNETRTTYVDFIPC